MRVDRLDLCRTAHLLVQQYGRDDTLLMVAKRCDALFESDALLELGDVDRPPWSGTEYYVERARECPTFNL